MMSQYVTLKMFTTDLEDSSGLFCTHIWRTTGRF